MARRISRRHFLTGLAGAGASTLLAACAPTAPEVIEVQKEVPVEKVVKETVVVQKEVAVEKVVTATPLPPEELQGEVMTVWKDDNYWESPPGQTKVQMFNEKHPQIKLTGIGAGGDYEFVQKVTTMFAGGQPPDLLGLTGGRIIHLAPKGVFEDLQPRIDASPLMQRIWKDLPGGVVELKFMGQQCGVTRDQNLSIWFYNRDLFDEEGVDYPSLDWTWDDMVEIGSKVTDPEKNQYLLVPGTVSFQDASMWFWQAGGTLFSEDCLHINFDQEPNIQSMEFLVDLFNKYKVLPPREMQLGEIGISFDSGKLAVNSGSSGHLMQQLSPKATWDFNWSATYAPTGPAAQAGFVKQNGWSICKGAKNAHLAWVVIEWWLGDEAQTAFAEAGEAVGRNDIFKEVGLKNLPAHLHPAIERSFTHGRGLERCPGWSLCQKYWKEEMDPAYLGRISAREAMMTAYNKAQPEYDQLLQELGLL